MELKRSLSPETSVLELAGASKFFAFNSATFGICTSTPPKAPKSPKVCGPVLCRQASLSFRYAISVPPHDAPGIAPPLAGDDSALGHGREPAMVLKDGDQLSCRRLIPDGVEAALIDVRKRDC